MKKRTVKLFLSQKKTQITSLQSHAHFWVHSLALRILNSFLHTGLVSTKGAERAASQDSYSLVRRAIFLNLWCGFESFQAEEGNNPGFLMSWTSAITILYLKNGYYHLKFYLKGSGSGNCLMSSIWSCLLCYVRVTGDTCLNPLGGLDECLVSKSR